MLDFDNMVLGLRDGAGPKVALRFAEEPEVWLDRLMQGNPRRALVRRCYMNPAGSIEDEESGVRRFFSTFRWAFQAAGFEVVDCPKLTRLKNAADVRIALDAMELAALPTARIDEFTILSTDCDFVPLLLRLRAADRLTRLVAHPDVGRVLKASADTHIGLDEVAAWLGWQRDAAAVEAAFGHELEDAVLITVRDAMAEAQAPVPLPLLGTVVRDRTGRTIRESNWGGCGSWDKLLETVGGFVRRDGPGGGFALRSEWIGAVPTMVGSAAAEAPTQRGLDEAVLTAVRDVMAAAQEPISLPALGSAVRRITGRSLRESNYGGAGSWDSLLNAVGGLTRKVSPGGGFVVRDDRIEEQG
ncbi:NYN domain-containing protein [Roseomonas sp. SSH11]|uniref:NYN domain-containing protein n=1 Tax=Pararoseomonas baculiformis TaxID=2820812 RepID=A0ABS4ALE7_9PROT|nr:NYN domain-containing protein [Pararoseomonas baculiformis]MBP0447842.1 NYN domain-containing protein [Pararoseomonas baculiformis]